MNKASYEKFHAEYVKVIDRAHIVAVKALSERNIPASDFSEIRLPFLDGKTDIFWVEYWAPGGYTEDNMRSLELPMELIFDEN